MKTLSSIVPSSLGLILGLALATGAHAALLLPGTADPAGGGPTVLPTSLIVSTLTSPMNSGGIHGSIESDVYAPDATNPLGGLTFVYTVTNAAVSDVLSRVDFTNFAAYTLDVGYVPTTAAIPSAATRSTIAQDNGDEVGFNFDDGFGSPTFAPGTTEVLVVHTTALNFAFSTANALDNGAVNVDALGPAPVPEPASFGLVALIGLLIRRK